LLVSFMLGWGVTIGAGFASYPLDTIRYACIFLSRIPFLLSISRRMMMTSGSGVNYKSMFDAGSQVNQRYSCIYLFPTLGICRSLRKKGSSRYSKALEPIFSGEWLVLVSLLCTTSCKKFCLEKFTVEVNTLLYPSLDYLDMTYSRCAS